MGRVVPWFLLSAALLGVNIADSSSLLLQRYPNNCNLKCGNHTEEINNNRANITNCSNGEWEVNFKNFSCEVKTTVECTDNKGTVHNVTHTTVECTDNKGTVHNVTHRWKTAHHPTTVPHPPSGAIISRNIIIICISIISVIILGAISGGLIYWWRKRESNRERNENDVERQPMAPDAVNGDRTPKMRTIYREATSLHNGCGTAETPL